MFTPQNLLLSKTEGERCFQPDKAINPFFRWIQIFVIIVLTNHGLANGCTFNT